MADEIAEQLIAAEKLEDAAKRLEDVLASHEDPGLRLRLASILFRSGKLGDALVHARRSAEVESEHRAEAVLLAAFCLRSLKRYHVENRLVCRLCGQKGGCVHTRTEWKMDPSRLVFTIFAGE
ncbi:MAG: hypothetical protein AAB229_02245, partial [Candidatus Hydrogenedentota bacterium]